MVFSAACTGNCGHKKFVLDKARTNEIAKFTILDQKTQVATLDKIRTKIRNLSEIGYFGRTKNDIWTRYLLCR